MGFEVSRLVGDGGITGGVHLIEAVVREGFHPNPEFFRETLLDLAMGNHALHESRFHFGHGVALFFADSFAERVGLAAGEAAHLLTDLHELFLVNQNPIGTLERGLQARVFVNGLLSAMLTVDKIFDKLHRARAV